MVENGALVLYRCYFHQNMSQTFHQEPLEIVSALGGGESGHNNSPLKEMLREVECGLSKTGHKRLQGEFDLLVEFVEVWEISGLLSLLEEDCVFGWTWMAWSCWGTPAPGDTHGVTKPLE